MFALVSVAEAGGKTLRRRSACPCRPLVRVLRSWSSTSGWRMTRTWRRSPGVGWGLMWLIMCLWGFRLGASVGAERGLEARVGVLGVRRVGVAWLLVVRPGRVWG